MRVLYGNNERPCCLYLLYHPPDHNLILNSMSNLTITSKKTKFGSGAVVCQPLPYKIKKVERSLVTSRV